MLDVFYIYIPKYIYLEKVGLLDLLAVQLDDGGVVWVDDQGVQLGGLDNSCLWWGSKMLLLIFLCLWALVVDDQVNLVGGATLIRTKHDNIWGGVGELVLVESLVVSQTVSIGVRI